MFDIQGDAVRRIVEELLDPYRNGGLARGIAAPFVISTQGQANERWIIKMSDPGPDAVVIRSLEDSGAHRCRDVLQKGPAVIALNRLHGRYGCIADLATPGNAGGTIQAAEKAALFDSAADRDFRIALGIAIGCDKELANHRIDRPGCRAGQPVIAELDSSGIAADPSLAQESTGIAFGNQAIQFAAQMGLVVIPEAHARRGAYVGGFAFFGIGRQPGQPAERSGRMRMTSKPAAARRRRHVFCSFRPDKQRSSAIRA